MPAAFFLLAEGDRMGSKTPLYDKHVESGARIVDFGGWDMPLHYGSQKEEHHAVRNKAGMFDVSHMTIVDLAGERTRDFLRHLLANDVARLKDYGKALYTCMLNDDGGVIDENVPVVRQPTPLPQAVGPHRTIASHSLPAGRAPCSAQNTLSPF